MCGPPPQGHDARMTDATIIALRAATADDDADLRRLSALDSAPALPRPALMALADGRAVAALSLADGRVVADPFVPTGDVVALLRERATTRDGAKRRRRRGPWGRAPRLRPAA
jgi:hypothetical protein